MQIEWDSLLEKKRGKASEAGMQVDERRNWKAQEHRNKILFIHQQIDQKGPSILANNNYSI